MTADLCNDTESRREEIDNYTFNLNNQTQHWHSTGPAVRIIDGVTLVSTVGANILKWKSIRH